MTRIAVVGQVVVDEIYLDPQARLTSDSRGSASVIRVGGKGFNIAAAASRLGADVELVTAIGNDSAGRHALLKMDRLEIQHTFVVHCSLGWSGAPISTPRVIGVPSDNVSNSLSEPRGQTRTPRVRLTEGRDGERQVLLDQDDWIHDCYGAACKRFDPEGFDAIIFTLEFDDAALADLATTLMSTGALIAGNPAPRRSARISGPVRKLLDIADVLVPNRYEADFLIESQDQITRNSPLNLAERVGQLYGTDWSVVTCGADGWAWWSAASQTCGVGRLESLGVVDKVGASDVFSATLCLFRLWGADIEEASTGAGAAARFAIARRGGAERFPTLDALAGDLEGLKSDAAAGALATLRGAT